MKTLIPCLLCILFCTANAGGGFEDYWPLVKGNSWTYRAQNGQVSTKSVGGDTTVDGAVFHRILQDEGPPHVMGWKEGRVIIAHGSERTVVLKYGGAGTQWLAIDGAPGERDTTNCAIVGINDTRTVLGHTYSDVLHVVFTREVGRPDSTSLYFAKGVGLIESVGISDTVRLVSYTVH